MKKLYILSFALVAIVFISCTNSTKNPLTGDSTENKAYKELKFGMTAEKVKEMGYTKMDKPEKMDDQGFEMYSSEIKDMAGVNFDNNILYFSENQLVQVRLIKISQKKEEALEVWDTIYNSTKAKYGTPTEKALLNTRKVNWVIGNKIITCTIKKEISFISNDLYINSVNIMDQKLMDEIENSKIKKYKENTDI